MNLLIVFEHEREDDGTVIVRGERAHHLVSVLKAAPGSLVRMGQPGLGRGEATVISASPDEVVLQPGTLDKADSSNGVELIVGLPRPQSLKKVLQLAGTFGARRVVFTGAFRVEKSYFHSPVLRPEQILEQLRLGMEQGVTTWLPQVAITDAFRGLFNEGGMTSLALASSAQVVPPSPLSSLALVAHPPGAELRPEALGGNGGDMRDYTLASPAFRQPIAAGSDITVAIGPEGGWGRKELTSFADRGFRLLSLGNRILRVETAVCALFAQLELVRAAHSIP